MQYTIKLLLIYVKLCTSFSAYHGYLKWNSLLSFVYIDALDYIWSFDIYSQPFPLLKKLHTTPFIKQIAAVLMSSDITFRILCNNKLDVEKYFNCIIWPNQLVNHDRAQFSWIVKPFVPKIMIAQFYVNILSWTTKIFLT